MVMPAESPSQPAFDPFQDRLCRDIRNDLSAGLLAMLHDAESRLAETMAAKYRAMAIAPWMRDYLEERLTRYRRVLAQIKAAGLDREETYGIAVLLWDQELFFEVHEWLEQRWLTAGGPEKEILQALIRAAGTYVHLRHGRPQGAKKMAAKAVAALVAHRALVPAVFNVDTLIAKLAALDPIPPKFGLESGA